MNPGDCYAQWSSGARESYPPRIRVFDVGATEIAAQRPDVPGYSQDAEFALKVQQMKIDRNRTNAPAPQQQQQQINRPVTCTTNVGITTCF